MRRREIKNFQKIVFACIGILLVCMVFLFGFLSNTHRQVQGFHRSYDVPQSVYDSGFSRLKGEVPKVEGIRGVLVNHHLLGSHLITEALMTVKEQPKTVILISPNHFTQGFSKAQMSNYAWQTPYGILVPDSQTISKILENDQFKIGEHSFEKEHGISGIVPFIKKIFPDAKIVPIIIKDSMTQDEADAVVVELSQLVGNDTLVIGSFDFSHEADLSTTLARDTKSFAVVNTLNTDSVYSDVSVDSKPGLYVVMKLMKDKGLGFHLLDNTNSATLTQNPKQPDITSYITGYFK